MKKKNKNIAKERINKYDRKKRQNIIQGYIMIAISGVLLFLKFIQPTLSIMPLEMFMTLLDNIFGQSIYIFIVSIFILGVITLYEEEVVFTRILVYFVGFVILNGYLVSTNIDNIDDSVLRLAFDDNSNIGIIGAFAYEFLSKISIFMKNNILILILALALMVIGLLKYILIIIKLITNTIKYYTSENYQKKKKALEEKKKIDKIKKINDQKQKEQKITNSIITLTEKKLNNELEKNGITEPFSYTKEKRADTEKKINDFITETSEKQKEQIIKKVEKDTLEELMKENNVTIEEKKVEPVVEAKVEEPKEIIEQEFDSSELQKSIEKIFVYQKVDEDKKAKMLQEINQNIHKLEDVLKQFGVDAKVVDYATGPTITRYEITIPKGVRVNKVTQLSDEISMNLSAQSIRFEAPIPGKNTIGIETPNKVKETVYFSNMLHNSNLNEGALNVILGKDIIGKEKIIDIAKMPHLLIAGQTGSGKSVAINTIISTLISKKSPNDVKFILVDPKMVELMPYNGIPHLLVPVITDSNDAAIALKWAVSEMELRYKKLSEMSLRNIKDYNKIKGIEKMPYIVIVIDELADLMATSANTVEMSIARIAQKARAIGIHLIVATQRPSSDVITGVIKANLPSRISFALRSQIDSRTILDQMGAEKLLGMGDMLLLENGSSKLERIQGAYISDKEVIELTNMLKNRFKPEYNLDILVDNNDNNVQDPDYIRALSLVEDIDDKITISLLQRELRIGFPKASKIRDELIKNGIIDENQYKI